MPKKKEEHKSHHAPSVICYVFLGWKIGDDALSGNARRISTSIARGQHYSESDKRCLDHCKKMCQITNHGGHH